MIKINLLSEGRRPTAVRKGKLGAGGLAGREDIALIALIGGLLLPLLIFGGVWLFMRSQKAAIDEDVQVAQRELDSLQEVLDEVEAYERQRDELKHKIRVITDLKNNQRGPVDVMDAVSRALPELLWLDQMTVTGSNINLRGRAYNFNAVSNFIENLDKVPEFSEPRLKKTYESGRIREFILDVAYTIVAPEVTEDAEAATTAAGG